MANPWELYKQKQQTQAIAYGSGNNPWTRYKSENKISGSSFLTPVIASAPVSRTSSGGSFSVGGDDLGAPRTPQQPTSTKPLTGFTAGVQANNEGYMARALKKAGLPTYTVPTYTSQTKQPAAPASTGAPSVPHSSTNYKVEEGGNLFDKFGNLMETANKARTDVLMQQAEKPLFGSYLGRKAVGGAADTAEGVANAFGYWYQDMVKSGELQHNNALRHAAATAKDPETKTALESYLGNMGINRQQAENITQRSSKTISNFGDNFAAKTEEKYGDADFGFVGNLMGDVAQGVGGMLVRMPARVLPGLGEVITFASAYGNAKQSALKNGAIESEAATYALGSAAVELATEKLFGFAGAVSGGAADDILAKFVKAVAKSPAGKTAINAFLGFAGEGAEELLAEYGQKYVDTLTVKMDERSLQEVNQDAWYNALVGGLTALLSGVGDVMRGGNGQLPTADDINHIADEAAEGTVKAIADDTPKKQTNTDTSINDNPAEHTAAEQAVIERYKAASDTSLRNFIEKVRGLVNNDYKNKIRHVLNTETDRALVEAQKLTGTDTSDFMQIIKGNTIQHIDKRHGIDGEADHSMANIDDFSRINFVLDNFTDARIIPITEADPETKKLSGEWNNADGTPAPLVQYSMPINGTYYVVEAIPASKAKVMAVVSAYISQKTKGSTLNQELSLTENQPGNLTPKTVPEILRTSKSNIPQSKNVVNGKTTSGAPAAIYAARLKELGLIADDDIYTNYINKRGEAFEERTENSYNVLENGINNDITNRGIDMDVMNATQAKKALTENVGFVKVDSSLDDVDEALLTANSNQLAKLESIFGVIHKSIGNICSISDGESVAFVNATITNPANQTLSLCPEHYKSYSLLVEEEEKYVRKGYYMPVAEEALSIATVTHEYGHMLLNCIIRDRMKYLGWDENTPEAFVNTEKRSISAKYKWYENVKKQVEKEFISEIKAIAADANPSFKMSDNISAYGMSSRAEFFAEVFANSQLGRPNELGNAMNIWLKKKGLILR